MPKKKELGQFADLMEGRLGKREGAGFLKGEGVYIQCTLRNCYLFDKNMLLFLFLSCFCLHCHIFLFIENLSMGTSEIERLIFPI